MKNRTTMSMRTILLVCALTLFVVGSKSLAQSKSRPPDVWVCMKMGHGHNGDYIGTVGDTMEFRADGSVYIPPLLGKYKLDYEKSEFTITLEVHGTTLVYIGRMVGATLFFDYDGSVWGLKPNPPPDNR